jgi:GPI-anchor transamidase subunit U
VIEMFEELSNFYNFVLHTPCLLFAVPIALRFARRPLFAFIATAILLATFKPYPVLADAALYLALLPLALRTLRRAAGVAFLAPIALLTAILLPATHYQWIHTGSANSNFFYAVTLAWGGCQVILLLLLLHAVLDEDRVLAGKPLQYTLNEARQDPGLSDGMAAASTDDTVR